MVSRIIKPSDVNPVCSINALEAVPGALGSGGEEDVQVGAKRVGENRFEEDLGCFSLWLVRNKCNVLCVVGMLTRESIKRALANGIMANQVPSLTNTFHFQLPKSQFQITGHLTAHAHPQMRKNVSGYTLYGFILTLK